MEPALKDSQKQNTSTPNLFGVETTLTYGVDSPLTSQPEPTVVRGQATGKHVRIVNCKSHVFQLLDTCKSVEVEDAEDSQIFIGPCSSVSIRRCERCEFTIACKRMWIQDCKGDDFCIYSAEPPDIQNCSDINLRPFNGAYKDIRQHFAAQQLDPTRNQWNAGSANKEFINMEKMSDWPLDLDGVNPVPVPENTEENNSELYRVISDQKDEPEFAAAPAATAIDESTLTPPDDHLWRDSHYPSEAKSKASRASSASSDGSASSGRAEFLKWFSAKVRRRQKEEADALAKRRDKAEEELDDWFNKRQEQIAETEAKNREEEARVIANKGRDFSRRAMLSVQQVLAARKKHKEMRNLSRSR